MSHGVTTDIYLRRTLHYNKLSFLPHAIGVKWEYAPAYPPAPSVSPSATNAAAPWARSGDSGCQVLFKLLIPEKLVIVGWLAALTPVKKYVRASRICRVKFKKCCGVMQVSQEGRFLIVLSIKCFYFFLL